MKIETLVVTTGQTDMSKYIDLNLKNDAIITNQYNEYKYEEKKINGSRVKMITTNDRGVGKNRNRGLMETEADICILADDDMRYEDNYLDTIKAAFEKIKDADIIIFNIDMTKSTSRVNKKIKKLNLYNCMSYGAARIAFKRESIHKKNIWFSTLYGGGAIHGSGEDTLFLVEAIKRGLKVYTYPMKIATVENSKSSWFTGYNNKFFFDKGVLVTNSFPKIGGLINIYFAYKFKKLAKGYSMSRIFGLMSQGRKRFKD